MIEVYERPVFGWSCLVCLDCNHQFSIADTNSLSDAELEEPEKCPRCESDNVDFDNWIKEND